MRMLQNNLDPEVAEHPEKLVVYGGTGKAARDWPSFDAIARTLQELKHDETMLVQSGRPVGVMRTHEWAPRVLIANSNLVGDWANWEEFRRLEAARPDDVRPDDGRLVDLHRHPGHPAGHLRDLRRRRREAVRRHPRRDHHAYRRARRHGRRPAAGRDHERRRRDLHRRATRARIARRIEHRYLDVEADDLDDALAARRRGPRRPPPLSIGLLGNAADAAAAAAGRWTRPIDIVTDQTSRARPAGLPAARRRLRGHGDVRRRRTRPEFTAARPRVDGHARRGDGRLHGRRRRGLRLRQLDPRRGAARRLRAGVRLPRLRARLHPPAVLRGQGPVPLGGAVRRPRRHRRHRPGDPRAVPGERVARPLDQDGAGAGRTSRACPPASAGSATASATRPGCGSTRWSPRGELSAPRSSSAATTSTAARSPRPTARPRRWSTAPTRSPTGRCSTPWSTSPPARPGSPSTTAAASASAARSTPARWPSPTAPRWPREKIERVLTNDPGMGVIRHVDAGYDRAAEVAAERGVRIPMREGGHGDER